MARIVPLLPALVALAACSQQPAGDGAAPPGETAAAAPPTAAAPPPSATPGRAWRYTSLTDCTLVREEREEMPYTETLCAGPAGWALRIADSDARQTLAVVEPGGKETRLDLSAVSRGAFNSFGQTAEWRGPAGEPFAPDSLIVRFSVAEQPHPAPETAYLLAVRLAPAPCLLARVPPGPGQNEAARAAVDARHRCAS